MTPLIALLALTASPLPDSFLEEALFAGGARDEADLKRLVAKYHARVDPMVELVRGQSPAIAALGSNGTSVDTAGIRPDTTLYHSLALSARMMTTAIRKNAVTAASMRSFRMNRCATSALAIPGSRFPAARVDS